jgi:hypothetical protein
MRISYFLRIFSTCLCLLIPMNTFAAKKISNKVAVFNALDKITARITVLEVAVNDTIKFGSFAITPKVCYTRSNLDKPNTTSFVEIDEHHLNGRIKRIFTGWMFASSPGISSVEHPVYDIWLVNCHQKKLLKKAIDKSPFSSIKSLLQ